MTRPPFAEAVLAGFITDSHLEDAILGDLAEDWSERLSSQGRFAARQWYWQQCLRTIPHLLRLWWRGASWSAVLRTIGAVTVAFVLMVVLTTAAHVVMFAVGEGAEPVVRPWPTTASLVFSVPCGMLGGFGLASLSRRAPMVSVTLLGAAWIPVALTLPLLGDPVEPGSAVPRWYFIAFPAILFCATAAGGILAVRLRVPVWALVFGVIVVISAILMYVLGHLWGLIP
jgi:hypothetical protein